MSQQPSRRTWRAMVAGSAVSVALAGAVALPNPVHAQAMGGLGQRSSGVRPNPNTVQPAPSPSQAQPAPAPARPAPPTWNAPVMQSPGGGGNNWNRGWPSRGPVFGQGQPAPSPWPQTNPQPSPNGSYGMNPDIGRRRGWPGNATGPGAQGQVNGNGVRIYRSGGGSYDNGGRIYSNQNQGGNPNAPVRWNNASPGRVVTGRINSGIQDGRAPIGLPDRSIRITTPVGQRSVRNHWHGNGYYYPPAPVTVVGGPTLLGGYYYGNYCNTYYDQYCYPSIYSVYVGFPRYIVNPSVIVIGQPYYPAYVTPYLPFYTPVYNVTYNENVYYVASEDTARDIERGGPAARQALKQAYPENSYQAAFADIERAWRDGNVALIRKHLRDDDTKLSVYLKGKYSYSIASADFLQITRDAFDHLNTVSFEFTRLRKAKNGDVTAYGKHVYRGSESSATSGDADQSGDTVPFSTDENKQLYDNDSEAVSGDEKTVYISYTLRHRDGQWYIVGVNSSPTNMVK